MGDLVAKQEGQTVPANPDEIKKMNQLWDAPQLSQRDVIIPAILLLQPMSPQVTEGDNKFGQLVETLNGEILGEIGTGFDVIPFKMVKLYIERIDNEDKDFHQAFDITPQNESLPYNDEAEIEGKMTKIIRDRVLKFYVLLKNELSVGTAIPYTIAFKRSSYQAGQKMSTQMFLKNINANKTPASTIMRISAVKKTKDSKTWAAADVVASGPTPDSMISEAYRWLEIINSGKAKEQAIEETEQKTGEIKSDIEY